MDVFDMPHQGGYDSPIYVFTRAFARLDPRCDITVYPNSVQIEVSDGRTFTFESEYFHQYSGNLPALAKRIFKEV